MDKDLLIQSLTKVSLGVIILGLLLFLPAGSLLYWQGWLLMGILFVPMIIAGFVMLAKNPELLRKRLNAKEEEKEQKLVVALSGQIFIAVFLVAGFNWRYRWIMLPDWAVWVAAGLFLIGYLLYAEVLRENTYLSRTIEVQENHRHRTVWHSPSPDVYGHHHHVPGNASGPGFADFFCDNVALPSSDRQANQE